MYLVRVSLERKIIEMSDIFKKGPRIRASFLAWGSEKFFYQGNFIMVPSLVRSCSDSGVYLISAWGSP
jgi:hypothetical protein